MTFSEFVGLFGIGIAAITIIWVIIDRFGQLEERVGNLEGRMDNFEIRFEKIDEKVDLIAKQVDQILFYIARKKSRRKKFKQSQKTF